MRLFKGHWFCSLYCIENDLVCIQFLFPRQCFLIFFQWSALIIDDITIWGLLGKKKMFVEPILDFFWKALTNIKMSRLLLLLTNWFLRNNRDETETCFKNVYLLFLFKFNFNFNNLLFQSTAYIQGILLLWSASKILDLNT